MHTIPSSSFLVSLVVVAAASAVAGPVPAQSQPGTPQATSSAAVPAPQAVKTEAKGTVGREPRTALLLSNLMPGPEIKINPGLTLSHDIAGRVRLGYGVGMMGAGTGTWDWQQLFVGVKVIDVGEPAGPHLRFFPTAGFLRYAVNDSEDDGPGPSSRETLSATTTLGIDVTCFGKSGTGFVLRCDVGGLWVLSQSSGRPGTSLDETYSVGVLSNASIGYGF